MGFHVAGEENRDLAWYLLPPPFPCLRAQLEELLSELSGERLQTKAELCIAEDCERHRDIAVLTVYVILCVSCIIHAQPC